MYKKYLGWFDSQAYYVDEKERLGDDSKDKLVDPMGPTNMHTCEKKV